MALFALRLDQEFEFQSPRDPAKGTPEATTFILRTLSGRDQSRLRDRAVRMRPDPENNNQTIMDFTPNEAAVEYVRLGLVGWRNFKGHDGLDVPFMATKAPVNGKIRDVVSERCLELLDVETVQELAAELRRIMVPDEEQGKG